MRWLHWIFPKKRAGTTAQAPDAQMMAHVQTLRTRNAIQAMEDQINDLYLAPLQPPPSWTRFSVRVTAGVLFVFIVWAAFSTLDEVTTGIGKVIPTSREQVIQSMEVGFMQTRSKPSSMPCCLPRAWTRCSFAALRP